MKIVEADDLLKKLPVNPLEDEESNSLAESYVRDRQKVASVEDLKKLLKKWENIWRVPLFYFVSEEEVGEILEEERRILTDECDLELLLHCLLLHVDGKLCKHSLKEESCLAYHVGVPPALLAATFLMTRIEVTFNKAFVTMVHAACEDGRKEKGER